MIVAAKCNITEFALQVISELRWGIKCKDSSIAIIENYLESLNCSNVSLIICNEADCTNEPIIFNCNFNIVSISFQLNPSEEEDVIFNISVSDYAGGTAPFTYKWFYDDEIFDILGEDTDEELKLKLKAGQDIALIVTQIGVQITDANGCVDDKECWLTPEGIQCNPNYVPCNNPIGLEVIYEYVACARPSKLEVINA